VELLRFFDQATPTDSAKVVALAAKVLETQSPDVNEVLATR
jgi:hypothetical protein